VPKGFNGLATAAAFLSGTVYLGLAGATFGGGRAAFAAATGWVLGLALYATAVAPAMRRSEALTLPEFLGARFGNPVRLAAILVVALATFAALAAAMATAASVAAGTLGVGRGTAVALALGAVLFAGLFGGMRGVTFTSIALYLVAAVACLAPVAIYAYRETGVPLAQFGYLAALNSLPELAAHSGGTVASLSPGLLLPLAAQGGFNLLALVVTFAAGTATLPQVMMRAATAPSVPSARRSAAWALAAVLVVTLTVPAYAVYARVELLTALVGSTIDQLPGWVYDFGRLGLVRLCGVAAGTPAAVASACAALPGGALAPGDIGLDGDAVLLAFPAIASLPPIMAVLVATGALAATLAAASALAFALAATVGHDLYFGLLDRAAPDGRRLIVTRLALIAVAGLAALAAYGGGTALFRLAAASFAFAAAGAFPAVALTVWWKRATPVGVLAGIAAGLLVTTVVVAADTIGGGAFWQLLGLRDGLSTLGAGIVGLPAGLAVAVLVSLAAPRARAAPARLAADIAAAAEE
jgi:cation/acetate symporter